MTTEHRLSFLIIHFYIIYYIIYIILYYFPPHQKMKNEHAVSFFIFNFQKKRDEPNAGQVISFKQ